MATISLRGVGQCAAADAAPPDFAKDVAPIFAKYCAGCHNADEPNGELSLESFADLQQGGSRGAPIIPGRAEASLLIRALTGEAEPAMPPEDSPRPSEREIAVLRAWIDAGAIGPNAAEMKFPELAVPDVAAAAHVRDYTTSLAVSPDGRRLALGRYRHVDLVDPATGQVIATTPELSGKVNHIAFSSNGELFVAASGIAALHGSAAICRTEDAAIVRNVTGHRDALYAARLSPDGRLLATCSYDRQIHLWDAATGELVRSFSGHNGAVFDLAFSSNGAVLVSASADETVKIWSVATGERLDTLGQPQAEQSAVVLSPDDKLILAAGADRQVRMWRLVSLERPQINPLMFSRTAHDSPVVAMAMSPDGTRLVTASEGRELLLWDALALVPIHRYEAQPDVVSGIAFDPSGDAFFIARLDGSWQRYEIAASRDYKLVKSEDAALDAATATATEAPPRFEGDEFEPNNSPAVANPITANALLRGVIGAAQDDGAPDADLFRFHAQRAEQRVLQINAAGQKSPLDSKLEVLDAAGNPIPRVLLQAVRASYFTFRGHNSTNLNDFRLHGWEDMELNELLYANGEVVKLWLYPRGPDSGFLVYPGVSGQRYSYFGTTAITHALNEPCYIVEPHPPGATLIPNGLPQFMLYYENDDDGWRKLGADSRLVFTAPDDGEYLVRVTDVREFGGDDYRYELIVRAPEPGFEIKVLEKDLTIHAGSGKELALFAERIDDFEGEIRVAILGLPPGFRASTPVVIESGQTTAYCTIYAAADAPVPTAETANNATLTASAMIGGKEVVQQAVALGELKLAAKPKVLVRVLPADGDISAAGPSDNVELVIAPGETIPAVLRVERNGFDGEIKFGNEYAGRNLPHGVYVDNIGLNGLTLLEGETERRFFITAAKWVRGTTRQFHLRADVEGSQASFPVTLHVRRPSIAASASGK